MKEIIMTMFNECPYCQNALKYIDEYKKAHPEAKDVQLTIINEREEPERAGKYDYYYVPTFFVDGEKIYEGLTDVSMIDNVFEKALS